VAATGGGLSGGYRKYLERILPLLSRAPGVDALKLYLPANCHAELDVSPECVARQRYASMSKIADAVQELRPDVLFVPTAKACRVAGRPTVIMVRNMEPLVAPFAGGTPAEIARNLVRRLNARRACASAARVIAVSRHVRDFLVNRWGVDESRVGVVYHGVDPPPAPGTCHSASGLPLSPSARFFFTAGSIRPARGLEDLIVAIAAVRRKYEDVSVVVGGRADPPTAGYFRRLQRLAERNEVAGVVFWPGQLAPAEMSWCFYRSLAFVMTSRAEACPNTALEALSHGAICVSSNTGPMPEIFAEAAQYYRPGDSSALARILVQLLAESEEPRAAWRSVAIQRAADFNWATTATLTLQQLRLAYETGSGQHSSGEAGQRRVVLRAGERVT
jgi:glycosyltransferase involved in cell wall biosynthesis